jgi:predicted metalloendopeptidase
MNALQDRTELIRLESDLAARMEMLFRRCPALHGFSVQQGSSVSCERIAHALQGGLFLADVAWHQPLYGDQAATLVEEISQELLELVDEQPEATALLRGRTFARTLN